MVAIIQVCFLSLVLALMPLATACGSAGVTRKVTYSVSAKQNYAKGRKKLKQEDWIAASKYFSFIKARFPYSKYAILAELRLADAEFGAGNFIQAIDKYKLFLKFRPTHEMALNGYAAFRIGESYFKMLPNDWWLMPPSYEKDQSATHDAHRELITFIRKYPQSPFLKRAADMLKDTTKRLARHEWYVATFYWERNRPMGTVLRLRRLVERYVGAGYDEEALWLLGQAYIDVDMPTRAKKAWQKLIDEYPKHKRAAEARTALANLPS